MKLPNKKIGVVGLGYVGLPLAVEFALKLEVVGFDINPQRIAELKAGRDNTKEISSSELAGAKQLRFTSKLDDIADCQVYIVTVPTPIDDAKRPDFNPLIKASETVGKVLKKGDIVIYESTVYPGATEEICVPVLEAVSGLRFNFEFFCGYSPERVNPGDKVRRLSSIVKVTSGSTPEVANEIDELYSLIITAGTHKANSIRVAEAAKVIENTQRDLNIALINEFSLIFQRLNIDTLEVLEAAGTKWNFLRFRPGLVGGHCIGVDPYYLTHKAQEVGYNPEIILAGRRVNESMARHVAGDVVKLMLQKGKNILGEKVLVLGLTFKENCPDLRNSGVFPMVKELQDYQLDVDVYDPWINQGDVAGEHHVNCVPEMPERGKYAAVILAVGHQQFIEMGADAIRAFGEHGALLYDIKGVLPAAAADRRL